MVVDTPILRDILNVAKVGLAKKEIVEDTGAYFFENGNLYTFNDSVAVSCWAPMNNIQGAVKATWLYPVINNSNDAFIDVHCADSMLYIHGDKTSARIPVNHESYISSYIRDLHVPSIDSENWANLDPKFNRSLKTCLLTASDNYAKPVLRCVHWNNDVLESTDNYSVTRYTLEGTNPHADGILIPGEAARALSKFSLTAFIWTGEWLHFKTAQNAIVSCRTFEGVFPDLGRCLSKECTTFIEFPQSFLAILTRASKLAQKNGIGEKQAKVTIDEGTLTIHVRVGEEGEFLESCPVSINDTLIFTFDPDRLQKFLKQNQNHSVGFATYCEGRSGMLRFESENEVRLLIVTLHTC